MYICIYISIYILHAYLAYLRWLVFLAIAEILLWQSSAAAFLLLLSLASATVVRENVYVYSVYINIDIYIYGQISI